MAKRIALVLCLLAGAFGASTPAQTALTPSKTTFQTTATAQAAATTLTLEDLPPGFTALPPNLTAEIISRLDLLSQQLGPGSPKPENTFAFVNQQDFQMVLGFTSQLPSASEQATFDTSLQTLEQPEVQQQLMSQLQEQLKAFEGVKVTEIDYNAPLGLDNLADASTGVTLSVELQGQSLRLDCAAFRRNQLGAFTAVMYPNGQPPLVTVSDAARKLDARILQSSGRGNRSQFAHTQ